MVRSEDRSTKVGRFIRQQVIPPGMTVTEAARRLGVGRPALSNLLNGKAALSQDMAFRLEGTFGANRAKLLELQTASDRHRRLAEDRFVPIGTYAPSFLTITAQQIADWAGGNIRARDRLPVLLRRLIHASGRELRRVDFPGYDNAQRHGWDGQVEADAATPWVPAGKSFWEFGVARRPHAKAEKDYQDRLHALSAEERAEGTFVFVTPRNWEGKFQWVRSKGAAGEWKAVRAHDASDLEQWLETTISPRVWLAGELGIPTEGFETLDRFWGRWAEAADPPMTEAIFAPSVAAHLAAFREWLGREPGDHPFTVAADSREEAVAFLACLLRHEDVLARDHDRAVVFESVSTLRNLAQSSSPFMPIVYSEETEREIATLYRQRHCIVVRPRNAVDREADVVVELLDHAAFEQALKDIGITARERVDRLANESGRSPTVLRRRLSQIPAIGTPPWAGDEAVARRLIPIALVGAWHSGSRTDAEVLSALARGPYREVEERIADLLRREDCPVWRAGQYRGVVARIDTLFAISPWMTAEDVAHFLHVAECVLSESDLPPAFPEAQRLPAARPSYAHAPGAKFFGIVRRYSDALRSGICETLILLSVHGNARFRDHLGFDVAAGVAELVQRLLTPLAPDKLLRHYENLPGFAEAAPDEFLALLEKDLKQPKPVLGEFLKPATPSSFVSPVRAAVLWALERLAWHPMTFRRVVDVLARLSQTKIDDNYLNHPMNSLSAVFRSWMPQTAAPLEDRVEALRMLCRDCHEVGWQICIQQFEHGHEVVSPSARPRWRNDAAGAGQLLSGRDPYEFARTAFDLAIAWPHDETKLGDLAERLGGMTDEERLSVWKRIDEWSRTERSDRKKAELRERIRRAVLTRWGSLRGPEADQRNRAYEVFEQLAPRDPVMRHAWIFAHAWVGELVDGADEEPLDSRKLATLSHELRSKAMMEIWAARGLEGALALLADGDARAVGNYTACCAADEDRETDVLRTCLANDACSAAQLDEFIRGFLGRFDESARSALISTLAETATSNQIVRLFACGPFREQTWRLVDGQDQSVRDRYWRTVHPAIAMFNESEIQEIIDRLLEVERPKDAFSAVQFDWNKVETSRLKRLLLALQAEFTGNCEVDFHGLSLALESLNRRPGVSTDEMAQLEFAFVEALDPRAHARHGIPNVERKLAESPLFFVRVLALMYERRDDDRDPPEWRVGDVDSRFPRRSAAYRVFGQVTRMPGADADGKVDAHSLIRWIAEVRRLCKEHGRADIGDYKVGELLSRAPCEDDGSWPCRAVCEVLETIASEKVLAGFETGTYNARNWQWRPLVEIGAQERGLSARRRTWALKWRFDYPHVARILERMAAVHDGLAAAMDSRVSVMDRLEH